MGHQTDQTMTMTAFLRLLVFTIAAFFGMVQSYVPESVAAASSRRSFISTASAAAAIGTVTPTVWGGMHVAVAADDPFQKKTLKPLDSYLYTILRVREATQQETRLIKTGKFKDMQRANVKLAVRFMLNNYQLADNIVAASSYLEGQKSIQAGSDGQKAVQSLYTILEYFDASSVENIKVGDSMAGKEKIVINGLEAAQKYIEAFVDYFPKDVVEKVNARIAEENALNEKEFDTSLGNIVNPNPIK